jgi:class 3 adenylate cyclase
VRDLPTGTVTLLYTDLADSTSLMQALGDRYAQVLEDSRRILRDAVSDRDGDEVETTADNCLFVFRRARAAVEAAVAAQRALTDYRGPQAVRIGIAMALHTGEPSVREDAYIGIDVYRTVLACGEAPRGQVVVSDTTRQLVQDELPDGTSLRSLGERLLGQLDRPERLHLLEIEGLPVAPVARRGLPAGTVTFLFSDIEQSTRVMRALGDAWAQAHSDHRRLLREAVRRAGGREVDTQGDAFFAVFGRARDALEAAAAAQRSLRGHAWPGETELRVRMGIHTGEPTIGEEGYLGLDVVRGARICSAAHGGQALVSETTRALVRGDEPPDVELRDLGEHHLKDLDHPERLYQLVAPGLETDFAAPRSLDSETAPPLPIPALRIDTRERELVEHALATARDFDALGPAIEQRVERMLGEVPVRAPSARRRYPLGWALLALAVAIVAIWVLSRAL